MKLKNKAILNAQGEVALQALAAEPHVLMALIPFNTTSISRSLI